MTQTDERSNASPISEEDTVTPTAEATVATAAAMPAEVSGEVTEATDVPKVILLSAFLDTVAPEIRAAIHSRVNARVLAGTLTGIVHLAGYIEVVVQSNGSRAVKLREILLLNNEQLPDQLAAIHTEADLEYKMQVGAKLELGDLIEIANQSSDNFEELAKRARTLAAAQNKSRTPSKPSAKKPVKK